MFLQETVTFSSPAPVSDGQGGEEEGWNVEHTCRAKFRYLRGGEAVQGARLEGTQPVVATVRLCAAISDIKTEWIMTDTRRNDVYNIRSFIPADDRNYLEITAERGVAV